MRNHGNIFAAQRYEAAVFANVQQPTAASDNAHVERWIRAKYEERAYLRESTFF